MSNRAILVLSAVAYLANGTYFLMDRPSDDRALVGHPPDVVTPVATSVPPTPGPPAPAAPEASPAAPAPAPPPMAPPTFRIHDSGGKAVLEGTLPDEATKATLLASATEVYGEGNVIDHLHTGAVDKPGWLFSLPGLLPAIHLDERPSGGMSVDGAGVVELFGQVSSNELRKRIVSEFDKSVPPGWTVRDLMIVSRGPALSDRALLVQTRLNRELLGRSIEFDAGQARIGPETAKVLDQVAALLRETDVSCEIGGHTDGGEAAQLGRERALAAKEHLQDKGIAPERLSVRGYGDSRPLDATDTPEGRKRNRRIELHIREARPATKGRTDGGQ